MIRAIQWIIDRRLRTIEYEHGIPLAHLHQILRVSPSGLFEVHDGYAPGMVSACASS